MPLSKQKLQWGSLFQLPAGKSPTRNGVISEGCTEHSIQISQKSHRDMMSKTRHNDQAGFNPKTEKIT